MYQYKLLPYRLAHPKYRGRPGLVRWISAAPRTRESSGASVKGISLSAFSLSFSAAHLSTSHACATGRQQPHFYNYACFGQLEKGGSFFTRRRRTVQGRGERPPPLWQREEPNSDDTNGQARIFRKEFAENGSSMKAMEGAGVSLDVSVKRFIDMFCDFDSKRCKLCNEVFTQWHQHNKGIPHSGREGMLFELVRPFCGTPDELMQRWWHQLNSCEAFQRIPALSHHDSHIRKRRVQYLLHLLKDCGVLVDTFSLTTDLSGSAQRSWEFERLEFFGDNVVKCVLNDVLGCVFPFSEGGLKGKLTLFQFVMDGNEGLARGYDFLELQNLTGSQKVVSKFKSDIVETLFAELHMFLLRTQYDTGTIVRTVPFTPEIYTLRALVQHVKYELAIIIFLYHVDFIKGCLERIMRENQLQLVRADPALKAMRLSSKGAGDRSWRETWDMQGDGSGRSGSNAEQVLVAAPTRKLMKFCATRQQVHGGGAALFFASTNYDNFKRVAPLGGLLPRGFSRGELAVVPNFMPHVQQDAVLSRRLGSAPEKNWAVLLRQELDGPANEDCVRFPPNRPFTPSADPYCLATAPHGDKGGRCHTEHLSLSRLKDEDLIAEVI